MPIHGVLVENRVIVWNIEQSHILFGNGYYGKPLGVPKPKGIEFDSPLILDLMEGCYLSQIGKLEISNYSGRRLSSRDILAICKKEYANFQARHSALRLTS